MDIIPKKKKPFVNEDDVIEGAFLVLRHNLIIELKEMGFIKMHEIRNQKNLNGIRIILGQLFGHDFLYSQLHQLDNFTLTRTFYVTDKFKQYVKEGREEEIL